jgi:hypothetical protein
LSLACALMHRMRTPALQSTELDRASAASIRLRLLKTGDAIPRNTRCVRAMLASHHPMRGLFATAADRQASLRPQSSSSAAAITLTSNVGREVFRPEAASSSSGTSNAARSRPSAASSPHRRHTTEKMAGRPRSRAHARAVERRKAVGAPRLAFRLQLFKARTPTS